VGLIDVRIEDSTWNTRSTDEAITEAETFDEVKSFSATVQPVRPFRLVIEFFPDATILAVYDFNDMVMA
jgi:hypothetical protein